MSDGKIEKKLQAESLSAAHISSIHDNEVIEIGADLIPDDIDMYPRVIGSREMPFREVVADSFSGSLNPLDERDAIGARMPFDSIRAKEIYGNLHGAIHGIAFPGALSGYGWLLVMAENSEQGIKATVQRALWPAKNYTLQNSGGTPPHIHIHLLPPFIPFIAGNPVFAECIRNQINGSSTVLTTKSLIPAMNTSLKVPEVDIEVEIPEYISGQYQILIRLY